jgi:hypothetical protein
MIDNGRGLIVNTGHYGAVSYYHGAAYGAQKAGSDKMAADMAKELRPHNVAAVSIWMGALDTERARAYIASLAPEARPTAKRESPQFTGRVISALYASDDLINLSGRALIGAELGAYFGITDIDGATPRSSATHWADPRAAPQPLVTSTRGRSSAISPSKPAEHTRSVSTNSGCRWPARLWLPVQMERPGCADLGAARLW